MRKIIAIWVVLILLMPVALADRVNISDLTKEELLILYDSVSAKLKEIGYYPFVELKSGDSGENVLALQERLKALFYYEEEITGRYDKSTSSAMKAFEKNNRLKQDGIATISEQQIIYSNLALPKPTPTPKPTIKPKSTPTTKPTRKPTPTPSPTPKPVADAFVLNIVEVNLFEQYNYNKFSVNVLNKSNTQTIDAFDLILRAYDTYGTLLSSFGYGAKEAGFTNQECIIGPGKKYSMGTR